MLVVMLAHRRDTRLDFITRAGTRMRDFKQPTVYSQGNIPFNSSTKIQGYIFKSKKTTEVLRLIKNGLPATDFKQTFAVGWPTIEHHWDILDLENPSLSAEFDWVDSKTGTAVQMFTGSYAGDLGGDDAVKGDILVFTYRPTTPMSRKIETFLSALGLAP